MEMPEVKKFLGIFPLKYGCFLIAVFGLALGGVILAGIILYGVAENILMSYFGEYKVDEDIKKAVLLPLGISSLMLLLSNSLLFIGVTFKRGANVQFAVRVLFVMCVVLMLVATSFPISCFFVDNLCVIKKTSLVGMICLLLILTLFVEVWMYNTAVCWNLEQAMNK